MDTKAFLGSLDDDRIVAAIKDVEARSRGEVRVHVTAQAVDDVQAAAARTFEKLGMVKTAERNGVLVFVAPGSQRFAVIGDTGIHGLCGPGFWQEIADGMRGEFKAGRFTDGIVAAVHVAGEALVRHFPREAGKTDVNELPDTVSRD
jgi:uncharacterized membrane protein